jgi:hypothetical protein
MKRMFVVGMCPLSCLYHSITSICYIIEGNAENKGKGEEYPRRGHEGPEDK